MTTTTESAVGAWSVQHGGTLQALVDPIQAFDAGVSQLSGTGSSAGLTQACQQLQAGIQSAQQLPPVPDPAPQQEIQTALTDMNTGYSQGCSGTTDFNTLSVAHGWFSQAEDQIVSATGQISAAVDSP